MDLRRTSNRRTFASPRLAISMSSRTRSLIQSHRFRLAPSGYCNDTELGFTLVELLVVLGIFAILATIGLFFSFDFYRTYSFNSYLSTLVSALVEARSQSLNNLDGQEHGVRVEPGKYILFQGLPAEYDSSDISNLEIPMSSMVSVGGHSEIVFARLTGQARTAGGVACGDDADPCEIILTAQNLSKTMTINSEGRISW